MNVDNAKEKQCVFGLLVSSLSYVQTTRCSKTTNLSGTKSLCNLFPNHDVFIVDEDALLSFILLSAAIAAATEGGRSLRFFCLSPGFSSVSTVSAAGEANRDSRSLSVKNC